MSQISKNVQKDLTTKAAEDAWAAIGRTVELVPDLPTQCYMTIDVVSMLVGSALNLVADNSPQSPQMLAAKILQSVLKQTDTVLQAIVEAGEKKAQVLIFAQSEKDAIRWAKANDFVSGDVSFVSSPKQLLGMPHFHYVKIKGWDLHPMAKEIDHALAVAMVTVGAHELSTL